MQFTYPPELIGLLPALGNVWLQAASIFLASVILSYILTHIVGNIAKRVTQKTKTKVDDKLIGENYHRFSWLLITLGSQAALAVTPLHVSLGYLLATVSVFIGCAIVISVSSVLINAWGLKLAKKTKTDLDEQLMPLIRKALNVIYVILAFLIVLRMWDLNITPYLTGLGISGLVLGLALQDSLKNIFGGISMIFDRNFHNGDKIKLESGEVGEVLDIGLRSTKIQTYDNEIIFVPNGQLANQRIQNYREPSPPARVVVPFGVAYGSNVEKVKKVALAAIKKNKHYDKEGQYTDVIFTAMGDSSINFQARFWVGNWSDAYSAKITATEDIYNTLVKNKINIPFPTRTIYMKK